MHHTVTEQTLAYRVKFAALVAIVVAGMIFFQPHSSAAQNRRWVSITIENPNHCQIKYALNGKVKTLPAGYSLKHTGWTNGLPEIKFHDGAGGWKEYRLENDDYTFRWKHGRLRLYRK